MAQPSIAAYFNTRKRANPEDTASIKNRRLIDPAVPSDQGNDFVNHKTALSGSRTRSGRVIKRVGAQEPSDEDVSPKKLSKVEPSPAVKQTKLVEFIKKGPMSPRKRPSTKDIQKHNEVTPSASGTVLNNPAPGAKNRESEMERDYTTPTKQIVKGMTPIKHNELKNLVRKELNFDDVKAKVSRSAKLNELKASLARIQELEKTRKAQEERNRLLREGKSPAKKQTTPAVQLKQFDTIELEVLTSPAKIFKTPTKLPPPTPDKNELMSPRHTDVSKRLLFSPAKDGSPSKLQTPPAYERFQNLIEKTSKMGQLPLPFKYRHLIEIFKGVDAVCAMLHNRKECITFKKLKPAVQRMIRKNLTESHLAQIKYLYPEAFHFSQAKMRNYGSVSKADYFQLVIAPNVGSLTEKQRMNVIDEDNVLASGQTNIMNPQVMTERLRRFHDLLLQRVKEEHDKFLKSLDPPLSVKPEKVTRWHPDFDLENCRDIELGHLPQPPNVEKYSSARDILSTARNLFNCATPIERALERYEAKMDAQKMTTAGENTKNPKTPVEVPENQTTTETKVQPEPSKTKEAPLTAPSEAINDPTASLLKGLPKSLIEKIRAKQAAKALDAMTRRPSQDQEATKYSRLPELARHLRNVFVTERKGVLPLEIVLKKIQNSFRANLNPQEIESHLRLLSKELPDWVAFHDVRKTMYVKIAKDMNLAKIVSTLEALANEKCK